MDFLNHREGDMVFYKVLLLFLYSVHKIKCRNCKRLRELSLKKYISQGKAVEVAVNSKEEKS
jgi:hypothetical protein